MANKSRPHQVMCRLNSEELEKYKSLLEESGLSSQDFIRKAITTKRFSVVKKEVPEVQNKENAELLFQLSKLGTNVNQIAKKLNERQGYIDYANINQTAKEVNKLIADIRDNIKSKDDMSKYFG